MGRNLKRTIPLSLYSIKYFSYLLLAILVIAIAALFSFTAIVVSDSIYPANYAEKQAEAAQERIESAAYISPQIIPDLCRYALFDSNGILTGGNLKGINAKAAWYAVCGKTQIMFGSIYKLIPRDDGYCVLMYKIVPQYRSAALRRCLLPPQELVVVSSLVLVFLSVILIALKFGQNLKKKMASLISVTEKIQNQDLNFSVEKSSIKEIDSVLSSMDKLRHELKSSLESQWKAERSRKEQISALAHDLKTPLTIVRGNAEILYDTAPTQQQSECIKNIDESSLQMQSYIKALIELNKNTTPYTPVLQEIFLPDFIQRIKETASGLCAGKKIQLTWQNKSKREYLRADEKLLERAIGNIFSNAVEYSPEGGTVAAEVIDENGNIVFTVCDSGKGFSPEALNHAAEQFYMEDAGRNSKPHYGLGLYVADNIIKQHGGRLILENMEKQAGAKVTILIPAGKEEQYGTDKTCS